MVLQQLANASLKSLEWPPMGGQHEVGIQGSHFVQRVQKVA
jgi:hypothetical protein